MGKGQKSIADRGMDLLSETAESGALIADGGMSLVHDAASEAWSLAQWSNRALQDHFFGDHERTAPEVDPRVPWSDDGLKDRIGWRYEAADGTDLAGDDKLVELMNTLAAPEPDTADPEARAAWESANHEAVLQLNHLRGSPVEPDAALEEYQRFRTLQAEATERAGATPALDPAMHPHHMGSIQQLRTGSYTGEVLGVDPVYGALLSPTGGLVGPGNGAAAAPADSPASFHGEAHDAFGYLKSHHDVGPGYMYAAPGETGKFSGSDPAGAAPLLGQNSGFEKWHQLFEQADAFGPQTPMDVDQELGVTIESILPKLGEDLATNTLGLPQWTLDAAEGLGGLVPDAVKERLPDPDLAGSRWLGDGIELAEDAIHLAGAAADWMFD